jgi:signal transduction histidine kinase
MLKFKSYDHTEKFKNIFREGAQQERVVEEFKRIFGDPRRYQQIILNFLSNALKFTQLNGVVTINLILLEK